LFVIGKRLLLIASLCYQKRDKTHHTKNKKMQTNTIEPAILVNMVLTNWNLQNSKLANILNSFSNEQLAAETAPNRNTGIYIVGHLIAVSDGILPLLGFQDKLYPSLQHIFIDNADKAGIDFPSLATLKNNFEAVNQTLQQHFLQTAPIECFTKHLAITDEEFVKEPYRNKLNVMINRTNHLSYHLGQLIYLKK